MLTQTQDTYPYPVARIGIIGGGQLGRMLVKATKKLGCTSVVLDPTPHSPAGQLSGQQIVANYHDPVALRELVECCDLTTFDLEAIDSTVLLELDAEGHAIYPRPQLLAVIQDKLRQKQALAAAGLPVAEFAPLPEPNAAQCADFGYPLVQKACRGGYDGRGVAVLHTKADFHRHLPVPSLIERWVPAVKELAVMVARGHDGDCRCYPAVEMRVCPDANILDWLLAPAQIAPSLREAAEQLAMQTITALDGIGIFGVELFLTADDALLINEVAPRTHNSGHYTIEACPTNQFEQHLRAIAGLPLGSTELLVPAAMINLLGAPGYSGRPIIQGLRAALAIPGVSVHIYGKDTTRPLRKMGHVTVLDHDMTLLMNKIAQVRELITIVGEETL